MEVCITKPQWGRVWLSFCYPRAHLGSIQLQCDTQGLHFGMLGLWTKAVCVFFALWGTLGLHLDILGFHLCTIGAPLGPFGHHLGTLGVQLGVIWVPLGSIWGPLGPFSCLFNTVGRGPRPLWSLLGKSLEKGTTNYRNRYQKWMHFR